MFAQVESGSITSFPKGNKGISITTTAEVDGENVDTTINYPRTIYTLWTEAERNAIGIYTVIIDNTNFKDQTFYINTDQTYTFDADADTVTVTYGTATAKAIADTTWSQQDSDDDLMPSDKSVGDIKTTGLKTNYKNQFNLQAAGLLLPTDWYVVKATEISGYSVPSAITTYRAAVRTKVNAMETAIDGCANVAALITLLEYTTNDAGVSSRPLGEFPDEVV
tara:strand:+ start:369 stop:1034 length:666 start_codon:yes stop_codon:yes gene_type:complete